MNTELLAWFSNLLNFLILTYIAVNIVNTRCFSTTQMTLSFIGLISSIFVNMVATLTKK